MTAMALRARETSDDERLEREVQALAREIAAAGASERANLFHLGWWSERMLDWAMSHPSFKTQLFRFVDVFPACRDDAEVLRHVREYFDGVPVPRALDLGLDVAEQVPLGALVSAAVARRNVLRMARQFIAGATPADALPRLERLWRDGEASTVDLLGEKMVTEEEAARYAARVEELLDVLVRRHPGVAAVVAPRARPVGRCPARERLGEADGALAALHAAHGGGGNRGRDVRDSSRCSVAHERPARRSTSTRSTTTRRTRRLRCSARWARSIPTAAARLCRPGLPEGLLRGSPRPRGVVRGTLRMPLAVRLVKGAYWDHEAIVAAAAGWPVPVFQAKAETDANYERCVRHLIDHAGEVRPAIASHNLRSLAYAIAYARARGLPAEAVEHQLLYGMAEPVHAALVG